MRGESVTVAGKHWIWVIDLLSFCLLPVSFVKLLNLSEDWFTPLFQGLSPRLLHAGN